MSLVCAGINHHTAPVALRERLAFGAEAQQQLVTAAPLQALGAREVAVLFTCNRTEIYAAPPPADAAQLPPLLSALANLPLPALEPHTYVHLGSEAVRHLCRVAAGVDSMVLGESEILGQVAAAHETAVEAGRSGPLLEAAFRAALHAGRRARTETAIGRGPGSVSSEAVRFAQRAVGSLAERSVLVVGTGRMGQLTGKVLRAKGCGRLAVISRTTAHAESLAAACGGTALGWHELSGAIAGSDVIFCTTGAPHAVVTRELVAHALGPHGDGRPRLFVDIALPRDVEPGVASIPGVRVHDLDTLQRRVQDTLEERHGEVPAVERIVSEEVARFEQWCRAAEVRPLVVEMREQGETIRQRELGRLLRRLGDVPGPLLAELETFSASLVSKLLHEPTRRLRETSDPERARAIRQATRDLFGLGGAP